MEEGAECQAYQHTQEVSLPTYRSSVCWHLYVSVHTEEVALPTYRCMLASVCFLCMSSSVVALPTYRSSVCWHLYVSVHTEEVALYVGICVFLYKQRKKLFQHRETETYRCQHTEEEAPPPLRLYVVIPTYRGSCSSNIERQKHTDADIQRKKLLFLLDSMLLCQHTEEEACQAGDVACYVVCMHD